VASCCVVLHNLCIDILYVKSLQHVSAFRPSSGIVCAPFTLSAPFPAQANVYIWVYFVLAVIYLLVQCPCLSYNIKTLRCQMCGYYISYWLKCLNYNWQIIIVEWCSFVQCCRAGCHHVSSLKVFTEVLSDVILCWWAMGIMMFLLLKCPNYDRRIYNVGLVVI
jgi:hypothetical protein